MKLPVATPGQRKEIDTLMKAIGINPLQTIELYARDIARFIIKKKDPVVIFCGKGRNAGVGLCVAKHLMNYQVKVAVVLCEEEKKFKKEEKLLHETLIRLKADVVSITEEGIDEMLSRTKLAVDALIGYKLHSNPEGNIKKAIDFINESKIEVLAIDIPTGVDSITGKTHKPFISAKYTICPGIAMTGTKSKHCGKVFLSDVGIPDLVYDACHFNTKPNFRRKEMFKK